MANAARDYYRVLGLTTDASPLAIERAYRELLAELEDEVEAWGSSEELDRVRAEALEAYTVLSNPRHRRDYDALRAVPAWWSEFIDEDLPPERPETPGPDFLDTVLRRLVASRPLSAEEEVEILLPFEVAALGGKARLRIPTRHACPECAGTGAAEGAMSQSCPVCQGRSGETECPVCHGRGWLVSSECRRCKGDGWMFGIAFVSLHIPSGISDGTRLPFPGQDEQQSVPRPRFIRVKVSRHPFFSRKGQDVWCRIPISERDAREGSTVVVRTLRGRQHRMIVPPETKSGTIMRIVGEGIESGGRRGDQLVEILVRVRRRKNGRSL